MTNSLSGNFSSGKRSFLRGKRAWILDEEIFWLVCFVDSFFAKQASSSFTFPKHQIRDAARCSGKLNFFKFKIKIVPIQQRIQSFQEGRKEILPFSYLKVDGRRQNFSVFWYLSLKLPPSLGLVRWYSRRSEKKNSSNFCLKI